MFSAGKRRVRSSKLEAIPKPSSSQNLIAITFIKSPGKFIKGTHSWASSRCIKLELGHGKNWTFNALT
jgi:hypothetical protein